MAIHSDDADEIQRKNDEARAWVLAFRECNGAAWLGRFAAGGTARNMIEEWDGRALADLGADFVLPRYDARLERMIGSMATFALLEALAPGRGVDQWRKQREAVYRRIELLGGKLLRWYFYDEEEAERRNEHVTVDIIELWDDHTWTEVSLDVPRHVAESESQDEFAAWYSRNMVAPPGMAAVVVSNFNPDGVDHQAVIADRSAGAG
jgi:hypothetical protein